MIPPREPIPTATATRVPEATSDGLGPEAETEAQAEPFDPEATAVVPRFDPGAIPPPQAPGAAESPRSDTRPESARVAVVEGAGQRLSGETDRLRRERLRAAAWFLIGALLAFLAWRLAFTRAVLWPINVAVILGVAGSIVVLDDARPISARRLRFIEFAIFAQVAGFMAIRQYHAIVSGPTDPASVVAAARGSMMGAVLLMFIYTVFIPNTWRTAAPVILAFGFLPVVTRFLAFAIHPEALRIVQEAISATIVAEDVVYMTVGSCLAIYGTHVVNSLRAEAFAARQLNQYRLVAALGSGGMGDVYLAEHQLLKRPCALKLVRRDRATDRRALARFEREVRATARLSHPNTIDIYDYGRTDDGTFYYVMEFLPGLSLEDLVARHGPMPAGRAIYLLRQACGALAEAHASGLIHRDLKPANVFAARRGGRHDVAKVLDFGLVKDTLRHDLPPVPRAELGLDGPAGLSLAGDGGGTVQGTPLYMAPEQVAGRPDLDHRIDLYAMGGVAYTLLTGRPPFERPTRTALMGAHAREPVVPPSAHNPAVPDDLERVILRCLAKSPADRYPDADALEAALASCRSTPEWDTREAERWWRAFEPSHTVLPGDSAPSSPDRRARADLARLARATSAPRPDAR